MIEISLLILQAVQSCLMNSHAESLEVRSGQRVHDKVAVVYGIPFLGQYRLSADDGEERLNTTTIAILETWESTSICRAELRHLDVDLQSL
jgi:hypothetical protein